MRPKLTTTFSAVLPGAGRSCSRSDERTDVTPIIEARSETEPTESHSETVQAAVNIALVMASNRERALPSFGNNPREAR